MFRKREKREVALEAVLRRHLHAVQAPEELWDRVTAPAYASAAIQEPATSTRLVLAMAAALLIAALGWGFHLRGESVPGGGRNLVLHSSRADEIRAWVKAQTGLDVPLAEGTSVELTGAQVVPGGVEVAYRTGDRTGTLRVSRAESAGATDTHRFSGAYSWVMAAQAYTLTAPEAADLRAGCRLCHAGAQRHL